ncbi:MAG: VWA domain-containing protein [bacterium]|nr:VWA domain-containing protein [bacterium]
MNFLPIIPYLVVVVGLSLAAVAALVGVILVFGRPKGRWPSHIAFALRLTALLALAFFLLQPHMERDVKRTGDRPIAVLIDVSDSMFLGDGSGDGVSRLERAIELYPQIESIVGDIGGRTKLFAFADGAVPLANDLKPEQLPEKLSRSTTDLGKALDDIGTPAAAVVISDGNFVSGINADFPVFFVDPTSGPTRGGCWLHSVSAPTRVLPGSRFPVDVIYRLTGEEPARFEVYEGERKVASGTDAGGEGYSNVALHRVEDEPGRHFYRVAGLPGEGEAWATTEIISGPIDVSYNSYNTDYDSAYLRRAMASNKAVDLSYRSSVGLSGTAEPLSGTASDIIILANPSAKYFDAATVSEIEARVARGAGLLFLFSAATPDARVLTNRTIKTLMPLSGRIPKSTIAGGETVLTHADTTGRFGSGVVPSFSHLWDFGRAKPGSEVIWSIDGTPVLTGMRYGKGRVVLLSGGGFYRWEGQRGEDEPGLDHFAADLILYLYEGSDDDIAVNSNIVELGGTVDISAFASDEPSFVISGPEGVPQQLAPVEIRSGLWQTRFSPEAAGEYSLTVRSFAGDGLTVNKERILAIESTGEMNAGFPDSDAMRSTGDGYFVGSDLSELEEELMAALLATGPETMEKRNEPIMPGWFAIALFILLLSVEWTARRLMGLA